MECVGNARLGHLDRLSIFSRESAIFKWSGEEVDDGEGEALFRVGDWRLEAKEVRW